MYDKEVKKLMDKFVESIEKRIKHKIEATFELLESNLRVESLSLDTKSIRDFDLDYINVEIFYRLVDDYLEDNEIYSVDELDLEFIDKLAKFFKMESEILMTVMISSLVLMTTDEEYEMLYKIEDITNKEIEIEMYLDI